MLSFAADSRLSFYRLIELDEGIEALEAAIEFKNDGIANKQKELDSGKFLTDKDRQGLVNRLSNLAPGEAVSLLSKYFEKVVELRGNEKKLELKCSDLEVGCLADFAGMNCYLRCATLCQAWNLDGKEKDFLGPFFGSTCFPD